MESPQKRADLQGIRGIAIISVLAFHFFPKSCPNGYLGVDQFFVLSGFLMCMLLQKSDQHNPISLFTQFYSKRLKRILPLYLFVIFWAMISLYLVFPSTSEKINQNSASKALIFMSNRGKTKEEDYFQMLSIALDIFTHTWSLSVEIQFYLIIPLIYLIGSKFPVKIQYLFYISIACISYTFSVISTPTVSFNSVFARVWQFLTGFLIFMLSKSSDPLCQYKIIPQNDENDEKECQKLLENEDIQNNQKCLVIILSLSFFLTFGLIFVVFMPIPLDARFLRPLTTVTTGMLIIFSKNDQKILSNRVLTYFGDVSYALYLVHWPMYAFWKLTEDGDEIALLLTLFASIILSIIIHEAYEKWYLQQCTTIIAMLTVILYMLNIILVNKNEIIDKLEGSSQRYGILDNVTDEMTMTDAAHLNHIWSVNDYANLNTPYCEYESGGPLGWCRHKGLSGKYKVMSIGNSWAANHATIFHEECGHIAKSILQGSASACEPLYPSRQSEACRANFTDFEENVRLEKPDYVFMFTRFISIGDPLPPNVTSLDLDPIYQIMKAQMLKMIENVSQKMYILHSMPRPNANYIERIVPMMRRGVPTEFIDNLLVDHTMYHLARRRYSQLEKDCGGKCILVDYDPVFWNSTIQNFRFFDNRGVSYFTTVTHLSPRGLEHVRHVWTDVCRKII